LCWPYFATEDDVCGLLRVVSVNELDPDRPTEGRRSGPRRWLFSAR
jgi:hypothetical protein